MATRRTDIVTLPVALNLDGLQVYAGDKKDIPEWLRNHHDWQSPVDVKKLEVNVYKRFLADVNTASRRVGHAENSAHRI